MIISVRATMGQLRIVQTLVARTSAIQTHPRDPTTIRLSFMCGMAQVAGSSGWLARPVALGGAIQPCCFTTCCFASLSDPSTQVQPFDFII